MELDVEYPELPIVLDDAFLVEESDVLEELNSIGHWTTNVRRYRVLFSMPKPAIVPHAWTSGVYYNVGDLVVGRIHSIKRLTLKRWTDGLPNATFYDLEKSCVPKVFRDFEATHPTKTWNNSEVEKNKEEVKRLYNLLDETTTTLHRTEKDLVTTKTKLAQATLKIKEYKAKGKLLKQKLAICNQKLGWDKENKPHTPTKIQSHMQSPSKTPATVHKTNTMCSPCKRVVFD